jgi:hypothetical protein
MVAITHPYEVRLAARGLYEIPDVSGVRIACDEGSVWITLDNDPRDIVLERGGTFCGSDHRRALIYAFSSSQLAVGTTAVPERPLGGSRTPAGLAVAG